MENEKRQRKQTYESVEKSIPAEKEKEAVDTIFCGKMFFEADIIPYLVLCNFLQSRFFG